MKNSLFLIVLFAISFSQSSLKPFSFGIDHGITKEIYASAYYGGGIDAQYNFETLGQNLLTANFNINLTEFLSIQSSFSFVRFSSDIESKDYNYDSDGLETSSSSNTVNMNLSVMNIGASAVIYFAGFEEKTVRPFIFGGIELQIGSAEEKRETDNSSLPTYKDEENYDEYAGDLLSPFILKLGFGTEYFFNSSLSLIGKIQFNYNSLTAELERESFYLKNGTTYVPTDKQTINTSLSWISHRLSLGLNFYF